MKRTSLRILSVVAAGALGACGNSTDVEMDLSEAEAQALAEAVVQAVFVTSASEFSSPAPVGGPQMAPFAYDADVSFTAECPVDGTVAVDGSVDVSGDDETGAGRIELTVTHDHDGCVVETEDGMVFTFDGAPDIDLGLVLEADGEGQFGWSGVLEGRVAWSTEELEGTCQLALEFGGAVSQVDQSIAVSIEGAVCGAVVEHSLSITVDIGTT
jgi:hypothetical protein